jgi:hypothetical protein
VDPFPGYGTGPWYWPKSVRRDSSPPVKSSSSMVKINEHNHRIGQLGAVLVITEVFPE